MDQAKVLRGWLYNGLKKTHAEAGASGGRGKKSDAQNAHSFTTAEQLAEKHGVDPATIRRDAKLVEQLGDEGCAGSWRVKRLLTAPHKSATSSPRPSAWTA